MAVEVKRRGEIDGVEQLTRYLELMRRDSLLGAVQGIFAAQQIKPQARILAEDRGIRCVVLDYDVLRGMDDPSRPAVLAAGPSARGHDRPRAHFGDVCQHVPGNDPSAGRFRGRLPARAGKRPSADP